MNDYHLVFLVFGSMRHIALASRLETRCRIHDFGGDSLLPYVYNFGGSSLQTLIIFEELQIARLKAQSSKLKTRDIVSNYNSMGKTPSPPGTTTTQGFKPPDPLF